MYFFLHFTATDSYLVSNKLNNNDIELYFQSIFWYHSMLKNITYQIIIVWGQLIWSTMAIV